MSEPRAADLQDGFDTEAEALAFKRGVEYVNDSAITDVTIYFDDASEKWKVDIEDSDYPEDEEESDEDDDGSGFGT